MRRIAVIALTTVAVVMIGAGRSTATPAAPHHRSDASSGRVAAVASPVTEPPADGSLARCEPEHGPDPCLAVTPVDPAAAPVGPAAAPGVVPKPVPDRAAADAAPAGAGLITSSDVIAPVCSGSGSDGRRVQAVLAHTTASPTPSTVASIRSWAGEADDAVADSAARNGGSRRVRWVTTGGTGCSVTVVPVRITSGATDFAALVAQLRAAGLTNPARRYLVWTEGALSSSAAEMCGIGQYYDDDDPSPSENANATAGPTFAAMDRRCWNYHNGHSVPAHELIHSLGAVQSTAPHFNGDGHCTDDYDALCYGSTTGVVPWCADFGSNERLFDCGGDDYFNALPFAGSYLCNHWNTAASPYLSGPAPPPCPPPANRAPIGSGLALWVAGRNINLIGWALDPDTATPVLVVVAVEGVGMWFVPANSYWEGMDSVAPGYGRNHAFGITLAVPPGQRLVCAAALDHPTGSPNGIGCWGATVK